MPEIKLEAIQNPIREIFSHFGSKEFSDLDSSSTPNVLASAYDTDLTVADEHTWIVLVAGFDVVDVLAKNVGANGSIDFKILGTKRQAAFEDYVLSDFNIEIKEEETISSSSIAASTPEINNLAKQYMAIAIQAKKTTPGGASGTLGLDISCR